MKKIPLTQGKFAIVDDNMFEYLNQWKWQADKGKNTYYARRKEWHNGKSYQIKMHRVIMNARKGQDIDHKNHNGLDNRITNLRLCTRSQNCYNRKPYTGTSSCFKGVTFRKRTQKWIAQIYKEGKYYWIGSSESEIEASELYNEKAKELFGEFAYKEAV